MALQVLQQLQELQVQRVQAVLQGQVAQVELHLHREQAQVRAVQELVVKQGLREHLQQVAQAVLQVQVV